MATLDDARSMYDVLRRVRTVLRSNLAGEIATLRTLNTTIPALPVPQSSDVQIGPEAYNFSADPVIGIEGVLTPRMQYHGPRADYEIEIAVRLRFHDSQDVQTIAAKQYYYGRALWTCLHRGFRDADGTIIALQLDGIRPIMTVEYPDLEGYGAEVTTRAYVQFTLPYA